MFLCFFKFKQIFHDYVCAIVKTSIKEISDNPRIMPLVNCLFYINGFYFYTEWGYSPSRVNMESHFNVVALNICYQTSLYSRFQCDVTV